LFVNSFIENHNITNSLQLVKAVAVAILLLVSQNKAISQSISSAKTSQSTFLLQSIFLEISIIHSFKIYIAEASSCSLKRISHSFKYFS
jgi:hypothetical protein